MCGLWYTALINFPRFFMVLWHGRQMHILWEVSKLPNAKTWKGGGQEPSILPADLGMFSNSLIPNCLWPTIYTSPPVAGITHLQRLFSAMGSWNCNSSSERLPSSWVTDIQESRLAGAGGDKHRELSQAPGVFAAFQKGSWKPLFIFNLM